MLFSLAIISSMFVSSLSLSDISSGYFTDDTVLFSSALDSSTVLIPHSLPIHFQTAHLLSQKQLLLAFYILLAYQALEVQEIKLLFQLIFCRIRLPCNHCWV